MMLLIHKQLFPYWWKLAMVGIWMVDLYVYDSDDGENLSVHMQEGMENWIGLLKQLATKHIKPTAGWLIRLARYIDLYVLGGLAKNIIDFRMTKLESMNNKNLIWDDNTTPAILNEIENELPSKCQECLALIDEIEFGDESSVPAALTRLRQSSISSQAQHIMETHLDNIGQAIQENAYDAAMYTVNHDQQVLSQYFELNPQSQTAAHTSDDNDASDASDENDTNFSRQLSQFRVEGLNTDRMKRQDHLDAISNIYTMNDFSRDFGL